MPPKLDPNDPEIQLFIRLALLDEKAEYAKEKLAGLDSKVENLDVKLDQLKGVDAAILAEISSLKVKAGIWGAGSGLIISAISIIGILMSSWVW